MTATVENGYLVVRVPLIDPRPSQSGKTAIVASTSGFMATSATVNGQPVKVSLNATIPA